jgi:hypothetical protein
MPEVKKAAEKERAEFFSNSRRRIAEFLREASGLRPDKLRELTAQARRWKEHTRKSTKQGR